MQKILIRLKEIKTYRDINKTFSIRTKQEIVCLKYQDIYYFERRRKKIYALTRIGNYEFIDTLKSIMERIDENKFLRCHQGFIVNIDKILSISNKEIMLCDTGQAIPISRKYKKDVLNALKKKLFD